MSTTDSGQVSPGAGHNTRLLEPSDASQPPQRNGKTSARTSAPPTAPEPPAPARQPSRASAKSAKSLGKQARALVTRPLLAVFVVMLALVVVTYIRKGLLTALLEAVVLAILVVLLRKRLAPASPQARVPASIKPSSGKLVGLALAPGGVRSQLFQRSGGHVNLASAMDNAREQQRRIIRTPLRRQLTILVAAAKGGDGKTTTATNMANALNDTLGIGVFIVDVNLKGNVFMRLGLKSNAGHTVADLYQAICDGKIKTHHDFLAYTQRTDAGVYVIGRAHKGQTPLSPEALSTIHRVALLYFDFIVFDGGNDTESDLMLTAANLADISLEVVTPHGDSLQLALEDVSYLRKQTGDGHILVVLNEQSPARESQILSTSQAFHDEQLPVRRVRHVRTLGARGTLMWRNLPPWAQDDYREIAASLVAIASGHQVPMHQQGALFRKKFDGRNAAVKNRAANSGSPGDTSEGE